MSVEYNYYSINATNITNITNTVGKHLRASFRGRDNQPNIVLQRNYENTYYIAKKMYICGVSSLLHGENIHDAELVVEHIDQMGNGVVYSVFLLSCNPRNAVSSIDGLFQSTQTGLSFTDPISPTIPSGKTMGLELNTLFQTKPSIHTYQNSKKENVFVFAELIPIRTNVKNIYTEFFTKKNALHAKKKRIQEGVENREESNNVETPAGITGTIGDGTVYECDYIDVDQETMIQVLQVPLDGNPFGFMSQLNQSALTSVFIVSFALLSFIIVCPLLNNTLLLFLRKMINEESPIRTFLDNPIEWLESIVFITGFELLMFMVPFLAGVGTFTAGQMLGSTYLSMIGNVLMIFAGAFYLGTHINITNTPTKI